MMSEVNSVAHKSKLDKSDENIINSSSTYEQGSKSRIKD